MSDWDPATDAEAAMRDALLAGDQEIYFRILARVQLLLPVSADAVAGRVPVGWGTWTTGNRTHVLAFTSTAAMRLCLSEPTDSLRSVPFHALAAEWPNDEWWLAIDPGLPIEAYLPSWFISQLTRGDVRLPGRAGAAAPTPAQPRSDITVALSGRVRASAPPVGERDHRAGMDRGGAGQRGGARANQASAAGRIADGGWAGAGSGGPGSAGYGSGGAGSGGSGSGGSGSSAGDSGSTGLGAALGAAGLGVPTVGASAVAAPAGEVRSSDPYALIDQNFNGHSGPIETVDAEIIDLPPTREPDPGPTGSAQAPRDPAGPPLAATAAFAAGRRAAAAGITVTAERHRRPQPRPTAGRAQKETHDAEIVSPAESWSAGFVPANETEANLLAAAEENNTDAFLSTLLLAQIILPVPPTAPAAVRPRDRDFPWQIEETDGQRYIPVFTSVERLAEHSRFQEQATVSVRFVQMIGAWPDEAIGFAINPGSPVGATLPGSQIVALASWAADVGLRDEPSADVVIAARKHEATPVVGVAGAPTAGADRATLMQRTVPPEQVPFYLDRGYDRVAGFVNRASEVSHLTMPRLLYRALGLGYPGSPFSDDDTEVHVLRWVAHRADLYRLPYGGQHEAAMRAMQGWVIERAPFRGNGFAPGDTDVIAEFKVDSVRLPHGAQMWRLSRDGTETLVATFDADAVRWVKRESGVDA